MPPPAVSIVVTLYKRPQFIDAVIAGILNQTLTDWECVLVDDGSEMPELAEMCRRHEKRDARIKYIYQKNGGLPAARNRGAAESSAEFIAFCDDDDVMHPQQLEKQINFLRQNPGFAAVACYMVTINEKGEVTDRPNAKDLSETPLTFPVNSPNLYYSLEGSGMTRADYFRAVGGYDTDFQMAEGLDLALRINEKYPLALLREELRFYRVHSAEKLSLRPLADLHIPLAYLAAHYRRNNIPEPQGERPLNLLTAAVKDLPAEHIFYAYRKMRSYIKWAMRERLYEQMADMLRRFNAAFSFSKKYRRKLYWKIIMWAFYHGRFAALPVIVKNMGAL